MGTKVNIMDMQVDLLTKETLKQEMQNFLENETVNVAHVISPVSYTHLTLPTTPYV